MNGNLYADPWQTPRDRDYLMIDKLFKKDLFANSVGLEIEKIVIGMARAFGGEIVAKCVGTEQVLQKIVQATRGLCL